MRGATEEKRRREGGREEEREAKGAKQKQRGISVVGGGGRSGRSGRSALLSSSGRVICEDAPVVVITWDLRLPKEREGRMGPATAGNGTDRFLLLLWRVTSHDPGMFMRPDSRRPWRRTAAEKPNQRASSQSSWLPGPSSSSGPFFPIDPSGENGELHR